MIGFLKQFFQYQFVLIVAVVLIGMQINSIITNIRNLPEEVPIPVHFSDKIFTKDELATFNGENNSPIYLAILGSVYDVTKGAKHYGPGSAYNYFVARDASLSFITGEFEKFDEAKADDVLSLKDIEDLLALSKWKEFYDNDYTYVGKVVGRFYNQKGEPTLYHCRFRTLVDQARILKKHKDKTRIQFPDCNVEWSKETGTRVWCTTSSGGKERDWIGVPRKLYTVGSKDFRCACVKEEELGSTTVMLKSYENCEPNATECFFGVD